MNGQQLLTAHLAQWAEGQGVSLKWVEDTLRFEFPDGTAGSVASFPADFWERFEAADQEQRARALDLIQNRITLEYRPKSG
ncbi:hypothetical protein [Delftia sp. CH05]|uniref:hypothetical protein n=1 Tax=Delftia sp. CH05 TaxID=2692194 RepID=UPI00135DDFE3|nr:hypothetical protein [Delftia sp. CH05]MXN32880.1 hypothetical protein [Delftia sp. CH05]